MILRRMMQHAKDQNWFAVFLDFVIVVPVVFIGMAPHGFPPRCKAVGQHDFACE